MHPAVAILGVLGVLFTACTFLPVLTSAFFGYRKGERLATGMGAVSGLVLLTSCILLGHVARFSELNRRARISLGLALLLRVYSFFARFWELSLASSQWGFLVQRTRQIRSGIFMLQERFCVVLLALASVAGLCVLGIGVLFYELSYKPTYDRSDTDYRRYEEAFKALWLQLDQRGATEEDSIDFSSLNNGEWKTACLFGGYTRPLDEMRLRGASISENDTARFTEAGTRGFRLGQVEEQEIAIAYIDPANNARFIHFAAGIGPEGQHLQRCIAKPQTRLFLAPR